MMTCTIIRGGKIYENQIAYIETQIGTPEEKRDDDESVDKEVDENENSEEHVDIEEHENEDNDERDAVIECDNNGVIECVNVEDDDEENNCDVTGREKVNEHGFTNKNTGERMRKVQLRSRKGKSL
ncbi:hypothetical protein DPMN_166716 [Dreissena polymorpha]|uniref:Uncharacterized protein n=1 Tax=Dreissena polymorpha TaxID=45954 RepID=A0A9D4IUE8_DREPO|nr:hypothetical protein DPMN_166716 [Dreissena polymorpha]